MKKRAGYEWVILSVVLCFSILISFSVYSQRSTIRKERQLTRELSTIRTVIKTCVLKNKSFPNSIDDIIKEGSSALNFLVKDKDGGFLDPFGGKYLYDAGSGVVVSTTRDYRAW